MPTLEDSINKEVERQAVKYIRRKHREPITQRLHDATPKDTGRAARGWYTYNTPYGFQIQNDVHYIDLLNEGHSKQAPARFVENELTSIGRVKPM